MPFVGLFGTVFGIIQALSAVLAFNFYVRRLKVDALDLDNYAGRVSVPNRPGKRHVHMAFLRR